MKNLILFIVFLMLFGCSDPSPKELINGYLLAYTNGYNNYIIKDNKPIVDTYIIEYKVVGNYVLGQRRKSERQDARDEFISANFGFFILDTINGKLLENVQAKSMEELEDKYLELLAKQ